MDNPNRKGDVNDRILKTASELFAAEGLYQVGINRIISEAGVAKATFYKHFATRDDLVLAYVDDLGSGWAAALKQAAGPFATHPADQLLGMFDALARDGSRPRRGLPGVQAGAADGRLAHRPPPQLEDTAPTLRLCGWPALPRAA
ncbi:TetR/AcrR family transcriptional regulator [Arthrobacter sp. 24S4-2]|uniref:TetR/AcrR family transcriptional regulator n=1 Tax=Arthrobacter sp. 24S4-2 TaxID=2575374 RepID=UPI0020C74F2D|nr:TetR/AcrR family transcriptional regulator [Arthrobacter sp. 24S4-2]